MKKVKKIDFYQHNDNTINIFIWEKNKLVRKIWVYPNGDIEIRDFRENNNGKKIL